MLSVNVHQGEEYNWEWYNKMKLMKNWFVLTY